MGTPITFQRGLNQKGISDDPTVGHRAPRLPFILENIEKMRIAREQFAVVASLLQLETIDAPA
jgi:hypothetical protein